jgi:hypothetical protein
MDLHKVDEVANWKTPTNKTLLTSFLGAVGYLAPDCPGIRVPMSILSTIRGPVVVWRWHPTHQRAFDEAGTVVQQWWDHHRVALDYSEEAEMINLVTDACLTGASGYLSQVNDLKTAKVSSFWSGKLNSAQQNYPVHEQKLLAIIETLKCFRAELIGAKFRICMDHRGLEYIMQQRHLPPRQHLMSILNEFDFTTQYIPGETNTLATRYPEFMRMSLLEMSARRVNACRTAIQMRFRFT